jgi:hypothetical protein
MTYQKAFSVVRTSLFACIAVCLLASCQDDELVPRPEDVETPVVAASESNVSSLTISGSNTEFVERVDCSACTFIVDAKSETIDGAQLGLKPGSVICLKAALKYGNLSFINLEGTEESPITIATCN